MVSLAPSRLLTLVFIAFLSRSAVQALPGERASLSGNSNMGAQTTSKDLYKSLQLLADCLIWKGHLGPDVCPCVAQGAARQPLVQGAACNKPQPSVQLQYGPLTDPSCLLERSSNTCRCTSRTSAGSIPQSGCCYCLCQILHGRAGPLTQCIWHKQCLLCYS